MAENDVLCLGLEYNKSFTTIRSRRSNILLKVAEELKMLSGADIVVLTISSRNRQARSGTLGSQYYLLQRWMDTWDTYVNVDSIEQLQDRDKLTVCKVKYNDRASSTPSSTPTTASKKVIP